MPYASANGRRSAGNEKELGSDMRHVAANRFTIECFEELIISALPKRGWVTDDVWREYVLSCVDLGRKHGPFHAWLIIIFDQGPTAKQREIIAVENRDSLRLDALHRSVMVTDSLLLRGILTAARWMTRTEMETMGVLPSNVREGLLWMRERAKFDVDKALLAYHELVRVGKD
jgi:hypothetical protein